MSGIRGLSGPTMATAFPSIGLACSLGSELICSLTLVTSATKRSTPISDPSCFAVSGPLRC
eukprot:7336416-Prorocentrum_lima.AAC.1